MGKGCGATVVSEGATQISMCSPCGGFIAEAWLTKSLAIGD